MSTTTATPPLRVGVSRDRAAARLSGDEGGECEQIAAFEGGDLE